MCPPSLPLHRQLPISVLFKKWKHHGPDTLTRLIIVAQHHHLLQHQDQTHNLPTTEMRPDILIFDKVRSNVIFSNVPNKTMTIHANKD
jgi:hypothetical protein